MATVRSVILSLAIPLLLLAAFDGPSVLVKIPKDGTGIWETLVAGRMTVIQELDSCYLVLAGRGDLPFLKGRGVTTIVLDRNTRGADYVFLDAARAAGADLDSRGRLIPVEDGTVIFRPDSGNAHDHLPPGLPRKFPAAASILEHLSRPVPTGLSVSQTVRRDETALRLPELVSRDRLRALVQGLQDFQTRYASTPQCEAAGESIYEVFASLGLRTEYHPFSFRGYESRNVIAEKPGETHPHEILIICGHYDSTSRSPLVFAPGADDNASGTAAVMEAARVLASVPMDFTVRFVAFSAEEWGLFGSRAYAASARAAGEKIIGVINLDMIAYADAMPEDLEVIANPQSAWLAERLDLAARAYAGLAVRKIVNASFIYSDHASFWDMGYPAVLAIEDEPLRNPHYHRDTDTIETLNFDFFEAAVRSATGLLAELGQPVRPGLPASPRGLAARVFTYGSLFNKIRNTRLTWESSSGAAGYNVYRSATSRIGYERLNSGLVAAPVFIDALISADVPFYYVVAAVGPDGREGNFSSEVRVDPYAAPRAASASLSFVGLFLGLRP